MADTGKGVKALIRENSRILVLQEPSGTLDLPGGRVEDGESMKDALHREVFEETSLGIRPKFPLQILFEGGTSV